MSRTIVDLDGRATVLDAAERLASTPPDGDVALMVAAGAPVLRSGVFLEVLRSEIGPRRLSLVTTDARARSVASSVHVPAYASLAALERHELDPTERLEKARRAAIASTRPATVAAPRPSLRRVAAIAGSLAAALLILAAVVMPEATVRVAPAAEPIGPIAGIEIRGTVGGTAHVTLRAITQPIAAKVPGTPTGSRTEEIRAKGTVVLENKTNADVRVPKGTIFRTADSVQFLSTADVTIPRSAIVPPFEFFIGKVTVGVEAAVAGAPGNVPPGRITFGPDASKYTVTNTEPTSGGDIRRIAIARLEDYDAAVKRAPEALKAEGDLQLEKWKREPRPGETVVPQAIVRQTAIAPASVDVIGKESFELTVSGIATAYVSSDQEPRKAIAGKLRTEARSGNDVDDRLVAYDVTALKVAEDGVTWTVTARGTQMQRVDRAAVARTLAGRRIADSQAAVEAQRLRFLGTEWTPQWWPLFPLLDARITVQIAQ
jgi:hypothetical protein